MFLESFFKKRQARRFHFIPYYYEEDVEQEDAAAGPRIKFKKIRRGTPVAKKSVRSLVFLAILLLLCLFYLWGLVNDEIRTFQIEDIRIEEAPNF